MESVRASARSWGGVVRTFPPAEKGQQVIGAAANGKVGDATEALQIQEAIGPLDLAAGGLLDDAKGAARGVVGGVVNHAEGHERVASKRPWNWRASPP